MTITSTTIPTTLAALEERLATAESGLARTRRQMRVTWTVACLSSLFAFVIGANPAARAQFGVTLTSLDTRLKVVESKTASMSAVTDANTAKATVRFSGVNVQIVDGTGATEGTQSGLGNLIIGYNETRGSGGDHRTGNHNLIAGTFHNYDGNGGVVFGYRNNISSVEACVTGGALSTANGSYASVSGGIANTASGSYASVSAGFRNVASGFYASVSGGGDNSSSGTATSVSGGSGSTASGGSGTVSDSLASFSSSGGSVSGGYQNTASGPFSSVSGGAYNTAIGNSSSDSGGQNRTLTSDNQWAAGSQSNNGFVSGNFSSP